MKKIIISIICVLFASTSFAQMVGASSFSSNSQTKAKLDVARHEFSIHGGLGVENEEYYGYSAIMKYKFKPSKKYDIRFLIEAGSMFIAHDIVETEGEVSISTFPILLGINYEGRLSQNWSIYTDLAMGINFPISEFRWESPPYDNGFYEYNDFRRGFALSPEIGFICKNFMFGYKFSLYVNRCNESYYSYYYDDAIYNYSYISYYSLFTIGFRF